MLPGLVTPTHLLLILAALAIFFGLRRLSTRGTRVTRSVQGRRVGRIRGLRLRRPTRAQVHVGWLLISALVAFAFTRSVALPLFLVVFFALWACGYGVLARLYR